MKMIIEKYVGQTVGVNHKEPNMFRPVTLKGVTESHFSIQVDSAVVHYSLDSVIYVAESKSGLKVVGDTLFTRPTVPLTIQVRPLIVGSVGVGVII